MTGTTPPRPDPRAPAMDGGMALTVHETLPPNVIQRIEDYLAMHPDATVFHRPAWGMAVAAGTGQQAFWIIAESGSGILGFVPLTLVHSPLFGRALVSSGFAVGGGIIADQDDIAQRIADAAWVLAGRLSCPTLELRGGYLPPDATIDADSYAGFVRPLAADAEAELLAIPRKQRAEVRKGLDLGLTVTVGRDVRDRAAHHAVYAESVRNLGTPVFPRSLFDAVLDQLHHDSDILTVWQGDAPVASVLSLYYRDLVMPYWGGGTFAARQLRANEVMYYALMNHARGRGAARFDFGRSKYGTGAFAYKKNWGFEPVALHYGVRTPPGVAPRKINPLDPGYQRKIALWRRLPLAVANRIGPLIARGLG